MSSVMDMSDIAQLVILCAVIFIPTGVWLMPRLVRFCAWVRWQLFDARRFRAAGSIEKYLEEK
ncbi:MAG: cellulose biosynthesis protein BcsF [Burkholderiaceae bacterium]|nr:cellulose biosynthesis protein BcsF [Burkholderiaceae bacterium]